MESSDTIDTEVRDTIIDLAEGNPGAVTVLSQIARQRPNESDDLFDTLAAMNLRGSRIWLGYKDYCGEDLTEFISCVESGDEEMIALINDRSHDRHPDVRPA